jgi:hypothetical protein
MSLVLISRLLGLPLRERWATSARPRRVGARERLRVFFVGLPRKRGKQGPGRFVRARRRSTWPATTGRPRTGSPTPTNAAGEASPNSGARAVCLLPRKPIIPSGLEAEYRPVVGLGAGSGILASCRSIPGRRVLPQQLGRGPVTLAPEVRGQRDTGSDRAVTFG